MFHGKSKINSSKDNGMKQTSGKPNPYPRTKVPAKVVSEYKSRPSLKQNNYSEKKQSSNLSSNTRESKYKTTKETERSFRTKTNINESKTEPSKPAELKSKPPSINNKSYESRNDKNKGAVPKTTGIKSKYKENTSNHSKDDIRNSRQSNVSIKTESRKSIYPSLNINERAYEEESVNPEPVARNIDKKKNRPKSRSLLSLSTPNDSPKLSVYKHNDSDKELQRENRSSLSLEALLDSETKVPVNSTDKTNLRAARPRDSKLKPKENTKPELLNGANPRTAELCERQTVNHNPKTSDVSSRSQRNSPQNKSLSSSDQNSRYETHQPNMLEATSASQRPSPSSNCSNKPASQSNNNPNLNQSITNNYSQWSKSVAKNESKVNSNSNKGYLHISTIASITQKFGLGPMRKSQQIRNSKKTKYTQNTSVNRGNGSESQRTYNGNNVNQNTPSPDQSRQIMDNPRSPSQGNQISIPYRDYNISSFSGPNPESNRTGYSSNNYGNRYPVLPPFGQNENTGGTHPHTNATNHLYNNVGTPGRVNEATAPTTFTRNGYSSKKIKIPLKTLQNFRDAYEKIIKIIQDGKEHLLNGDYKESSATNTGHDNVQKKSALEGFSDAQAGILPPSDIENSVPSGAPPSYTEVLRQDLLKTFSGKSNGRAFEKQESTQDILLDTNYDTSNSPSTSQHLENISTEIPRNISNGLSPTYSEPGDLDYNIYSSHDVIFSRGGSLNEHSVTSNNDNNEMCQRPLPLPSAPPESEDNSSIILTSLPALNATEGNSNSVNSNLNNNIKKENSNLNTLAFENLFLSSNKTPKRNILHSESVNSINRKDETRNDDSNNETSSPGTLTDIESCFTGSSTSVNSFDFHLTRTHSLPNSAKKFSVNKTFDFEEFNIYDANCSKIKEQRDSASTSPQINAKKHNAILNTTNLSFSSLDSSLGAANILLPEKEHNEEGTSYPVREQQVKNSFNNSRLLEFQNLPPPIPSITDLKIPQNLSPSKDSYSPPDVCKTVQSTRKAEEDKTQEGSIILRNSDVQINDMKTSKKRPPVPAPRRRFLLSKDAATVNDLKEQTKMSGQITEVESEKQKYMKPFININKEHKEVFTHQQLSIYSKQNSQENCKKVENIYSNIEEMQNLLKKRQCENEQSKFTFPPNNLNEGLEKDKNSASKHENTPISTSLVKSRCETFSSWNQNNNFEKDVTNAIFTEGISSKSNHRGFINYENNKEVNTHKIVKDIENNNSNDVFANTYYTNSDVIPKQPSSQVTSNFRGAIPKSEYKESTDSYNHNQAIYSRPILKSSPESSCTSPIDESSFKKSWSTGHGVFGPRNGKSKSVKYTPSLLREFDPLSQKSNSISSNNLDINSVFLRPNNSNNVSREKAAVHQNRILDTEVTKLSKTECSNLKPSFKLKSEETQVNREAKTLLQESQTLQNKIEKLEPGSPNSNIRILDASNEPNFELTSRAHTLESQEQHENKDFFKIRTSTYKELSQDFVAETNNSPKEKEIGPNQNVLTSQNFPQDFLKPLEIASNQTFQSCSSRNSESASEDNASNSSLSERTNLTKSERKYSKMVVKNKAVQTNISEIQKLPEDFLRPQNSNPELINISCNNGDGCPKEEAPKTAEHSIYQVSRQSKISNCEDRKSIPKTEISEHRELSGDCHAQLKTPENPENALDKEITSYKDNSRSSLKGKNSIVGTTGNTVGQSEFFLELKEETIPDLPSMAQWREILFIDEIKMYFIKNESEIHSPFYRPNLQVLEEITFGRNILSPTMKLLVLPQKGSPHWTRDLSIENVKVFKTVGGAYIFSNIDGTYVGIKFSIKTNFKKVSKFMSLLTSHTYFEKEFTKKASNPSKVSKLIDDLVGTNNADKIRITAKDVSRHSMRTIKFAKNALGVAKDQPVQRSYQEPETESTFGSFMELQRMGKFLEKSIIENNIKYY
ncbi:hypothetical protein Anas_06986 [Armadillidium nasatum]|uniref:Uncharacterized protein n=1 Tax=Armadillidium nasatum TaxID=96803 RepID=A0A5N5SX26_9CRUS|nr:hypothetical protein Anas_06986 [Armadillidium nasatum]